MDKIELKIKDLKKKRQTALNSLLKLEASLKSKRHILKFIKTRAKKQFWCLKRKLEKSGYFNLYTQVRKAINMEKELFRDLLAFFDFSIKISSGSFLARIIFSN